MRRSIHQLPPIVVGLGLLFGVLAVGEVVAVTMFNVSPPDGFWRGIATSVLPILGIISGGIWLMQRESPVYRRPRLIGWSVAGLGGFFLLVVAIVQYTETLTGFYIISTFRWAGSLGAATGLLIGVFEARSIKRALEAERSRVREEAILRERDRLDEFAKIVSHDLRGPLNVAEGRVELAQAECDTEHLDIADNALTRMDQLIEQTLTLARQGAVIDETEAVDLAQLTEQCWRNVDTAESTLRADTAPAIEADPERLQHFFENLYRNAVDHGGRDVTVTVGALDDGFYIEDDGKGIPPDEREDIFEPGYTTDEAGTGVGLSIVKQIVEAHNWDIRVTTGSEGGARFEITGVELTAA